MPRPRPTLTGGSRRSGPQGYPVLVRVALKMVITQVICNLRPGGAERLAVDLSCELQSRGHVVRFVVIDQPRDEASETAKRAQLVAAGVETVFLGRRPGSGVVGLSQSAIKFARLLRSDPCDVIHSHLPYGHAVASLAKRLSGSDSEQVLTVHTSKEDWTTWQKKAIGAQRIAYCSRTAMERSAHANSAACVIPNGVPVEAFTKPDTAGDPLVELGIPPARDRVVSVGTLLEGKNYRTSLEAVAQLTYKCDVQYIVCGAGDRSPLERIARRLGIADRVSLLGPRSDIPAILASSRLFLSASRYEGMPISVLEALVAGLPCVLSPIDEHIEVGRGMVGCAIAPANTPSPVAEACMMMLKRRFDIAALRVTRSRALAEFDIGRCAERYENFYRQS